MADNTETEQAQDVGEATKRGARHSSSDREMLRTIRQKAQEIGLHATDLGADEADEADEKSIDGTLVCYGGAVKALGDGKVGGYLVEFTDADNPDLDGEFFDKGTDYDLGVDPEEPAARCRVYYQHGMDGKLKKRPLATGTMTVDDVGVWIEAQLKLRDEYERAIYQMAQAGKLGWSSGTAAHLVEKSPRDKAVHIDRWPLGLDASLTPTPANPRQAARVVPLKSVAVSADLAALVSEVSGSQPEATPEVRATDAEAIAPQDVSQHSEVTPMSDITMTKDELAALVGDAVKQGVTEAMKDLPAQPAAVATITDVHDNETDKPFKSFGEFLQCVVAASKEGHAPDKRLFYSTKASGMNELVDSQGGFLVRQEYANTLLEKVYQTGLIAGRVFRMPIGANANGVKIPAIDEASRANGSRFGGVQAYWTGEGVSKTSSKPKYAEVDMTLQKLTALCYATDELLQDAVALEAYINRVFPLEMNFKVEDAVVEGTGVGMPLGILAAPCLVTVPKENLQAAATIVYQNVQRMWARMYAPNRANAVWLINQDVEPQLNSMALNVGTGGVPVYLPAGGLSQAPYSALFGRPVLPVEYCSTLGTVGDIILADLGQYILIDKGGVQTASSIHIKFVEDETAFRWVYRANGQPWWNSALTPFKGTATLSPFVALATRA